MRSTGEMMALLLGFAQGQEDIRLVGMEGSRTNGNIPQDSFQDYDVTYFVRDMAAFTGDDSWLAAFGTPLIVQKPEDMELFPPEEAGYSYLMLLDDYVKIDLTLLPLDALEDYLNADSLRTVLLDKDGRVGCPVTPSDREYWVQRPSPRCLDDCCNEFWMLSTYVVKGICRDELLFAIDHLHLMRSELLRMLAWQVGEERGYGFSVGKNYKFLCRYLPPQMWEALLSTYREDSAGALWQALSTCRRLFGQASRQMAQALGCPCPGYEERVGKYLDEMRERYGQ